MRRIGVHTSIAGGLHKSMERIAALGCNTVQIFSHNPRGWGLGERSRDDVFSFRKLKKEYDITPAFIHTSYLINLASSDRRLIRKSIDMVIAEMQIADAIGAEYVVLHTGSASGDDPKTARKRAADCLKEVSKKGEWQAGLLLENTAGERGDITSRVGEIAEIMEKVSGDLIAGICLDTCHAFSAGYNIRADKDISLLINEIEKFIGPDKIRLIHLNDSKGGLGSGLDRHAHIGEGEIGLKGISKFINNPYFHDIPLILETPKKSEEDDPRNIRLVKKISRQRIRS